MFIQIEVFNHKLLDFLNVIFILGYINSRKPYSYILFKIFFYTIDFQE